LKNIIDKIPRAACGPVTDGPTALALSCLAAGCGPGEDGGDGLKVAADIASVTDLREQVGGGPEEVEGTVTPGANPRSRERNPGHMVSMEEAPW
jgi:ABC-type Zn uptake system ZnuABC Zn-binding protein ZnuA